MLLPCNVRTVDMGEKLVDSRTGTIKALSCLMNGAHDPKVFITITEISRTSRISPFLGGISSTGVGLTAAESRGVALGEAIEDYCVSIVPENLVLSTWEMLSKSGIQALHPKDYPLFSERQYAQKDFPFSPFTEQTPLRWVKSRSVLTNKEILVPAAFVYSSYKPCKKEQPICSTIYAGTGCGQTKEQALIAALSEIIERDAMMIWWLNQMPRKRCQPAPTSWFSQVLDKHLHSSKLKFELWDISTDINIPCFFGLLTDSYNQIVSGGFACRLNPQLTALKSLYECLQNRLGVLSMKQGSGVNEMNDRIGQNTLYHPDQKKYFASTGKANFGEMTQLNMNLQFYADPKNMHYLDTIRSCREKVLLPGSPADPRKDNSANILESYLQILKEKKQEILCVDITLPDMRELGFIVLRVLAPGLVSNSVTAWPYLGNSRLYNVPPELGFPQKNESELCPAPMPYG